MARAKKTDATQKKLVENAAATQQAEHSGIEPEIMERMSDDARSFEAQEAAFAEQYGAAYELHGQLKATGFFRKVATVGDLMLIRQMKESKLYKKLRIPVEENGKQILRCVGNFEEYCTLCLGVSASKTYEDLQNLAVLGDEYYEATQKMGLSYRQLRALRVLPEGERDGIMALIDNPDAIQAELDKRDGELKAREEIIKKGKKREKELEAAKSDLEKTRTELEDKIREITTLSVDGKKIKEAEQQKEALKKAIDQGGIAITAIVQFTATVRAGLEIPMDPLMREELEGFGNAVISTISDHVAIGLPWEIDFQALTYGDWMAKRGESMKENESEGSPDVPADAEHAA